MKQAAYLESYLADKTFLVGHRITLADIFTASALARGFEVVRTPPRWIWITMSAFLTVTLQVLDAKFRTAHPNTFRFFNTIVNQPQFAAVAPSLPLCAEAVVFTPPKKEKVAAAPKEAAAPKAAKAPKAKEDDDEEPAAAPEARAPHPVSLLPAASFPLDELKRQYSNQETDVAFKWLEENFNANDYSLWKVAYKYPEELTQGWSRSFRYQGS